MKEIPLSRGKVALVDDGDYQRVTERGKWSYATRGYAVRRGADGNLEFMHRFLTGFSVTDHVNGNGLDNRRPNLRGCTQAQNNCNVRLRGDNTSGVKGVSWRKRERKWIAYVGRFHIGYFSSLGDAARAVRSRREELHGEFARHE